MVGKDLELDIEPGDIFFTRDNSLLSRAIRIVETNKIPPPKVPSHVGVITCVYTFNDDLIIETIEALATGVRVSKLHKKRGVIWLARMKGDRDIVKGLEWLEKQLGTRYDYLQFFSLIFRALMKKLGLKKNYLNSKIRFICSELVEQYAKETGSRLWYGDTGFVTPYDLSRSGKLKIYKKNLTFERT